VVGRGQSGRRLERPKEQRPKVLLPWSLVLGPFQQILFTPPTLFHFSSNMPDPPPWKDSEAKNLLRGDLLSGAIAGDMAPHDIYLSRPEYQLYMYRNFTTNLKNLRDAMAREPVGAPMKWKESNAKEVLRAEIISGLVTADMDAGQVYNMHPELYHAYPFSKFTTNLRNLRDAIDTEYERAAEDAACYGHDLAIVHGQGFRSEPNYMPWHRSPAAALLAQDVAEGRNLTMPPRDLQATRPEYQAVTSKQFSQFVRHEVGKAAKKKEARFLKKQQRGRDGYR
jgi:hypothetical protein